MVRYIAVSLVVLADTVSQIPLDTPFDPASWLKFGVTGLLSGIILYVFIKVQPDKDAAHALERKALWEAQNTAIRDLKESQAQSAASICEAVAEVQKAVEAGSARQFDLLSQAMWPRQKQ